MYRYEYSASVYNYALAKQCNLHPLSHAVESIALWLQVHTMVLIPTNNEVFMTRECVY